MPKTPPLLRPWILSGLILTADQLTKYLVASCFQFGESLPVFHPLVYFTYVQNTGAAFGLFRGQQALFVLCSLGVSAWVVREFVQGKVASRLVEWSYALVLGGAVGNLIDRVRLGYVIDFIDLRVWPVFNVGDSAITIGVTLLIWHALFSSEKRKSSIKH